MRLDRRDQLVGELRKCYRKAERYGGRIFEVRVLDVRVNDVKDLQVPTLATEVQIERNRNTRNAGMLARCADDVDVGCR